MVVIVHVKKRIAPHWVLRVACFGVIVDFRKKSSFCNCYGGWCYRDRSRSRRVFLIIRIVHMQTFLKTEDVTELYMVVMLCVSSLKPICGANSSLPSICFVALRALHAAEANRVAF